jgi:hypothetical protein
VGYQEQLRDLLEQRCALEQQLGDVKCRIEQALLMFGAIEDAELPGRPRLVVTDTVIGVIEEIIVTRGPIEFFDLMAALRGRGIETTSKSVRAALVKLCHRYKIRRAKRGVYEAPIAEAAS